MKKKVLFLLIPLLIAGLTGCVKYNGQPKSSSKEKVTPSSAEPVNYSIEPSTPPEPHGAGESGTPVADNTSVKVYLVFGENGLYEGNPVNDKVADKFLEHTKEITAAVGSDLPGKDKVTSSVSGSTFVAWTAYNNDGKITEYSKVPNVDGKILYASFTGGAGGAHSGGSGGSQGGGSQGGGETPQVDYPGPSTGALPTEGYGLKFSDGTYMAAVHTDDFEGFTQYVVSKRSFKQGQSFSLCDFGSSSTWIVTINEYSFGKNKDQYITEDTSDADSSKHKYVVLKDFNAEGIYIKLKFGSDEVYMELAH